MEDRQTDRQKQSSQTGAWKVKFAHLVKLFGQILELGMCFLYFCIHGVPLAATPAQCQITYTHAHTYKRQARKRSA